MAARRPWTASAGAGAGALPRGPGEKTRMGKQGPKQSRRKAMHSQRFKAFASKAPVLNFFVSVVSVLSLAVPGAGGLWETMAKASAREAPSLRPPSQRLPAAIARRPWMGPMREGRPRCGSQAKAGSTRRCSRAVPHPSTNRALCRLTSEVRGDPVFSTRYGRHRNQSFSCRHSITAPLPFREVKKKDKERVTAPDGVPGRSPTPVLTGPCAA